jgi:hypothetical protein
MAYQGIGTGITPNDGTGDDLLTGAVKINSNFEEIYAALGDGSTINFNQNTTITAGDGLTGGGDLTANRTFNVGAGDGISVAADSVAVNSTVVRTSTTITAGDGLTGGGDLTANRTFNVGAGDGISVAADSVAVNSTVVRTSGDQTIGGTLTATTFVGNGTIPIGGIIMWSGSVASIPTGWALCNGGNGTPNLQDRFIVGAGSGYAVGATGGSANAIVVSHSHTMVETGSHRHYVTAPDDNKKMSDHKNDLEWAFGFDGFVGDDSRQDYKGAANKTDANAGASSSAGSHSHTINSEGSSGTNANLPPYYALAFIMRTT